MGADTSRNLEQWDWTHDTGWWLAERHGVGFERATIVTSGEQQWLVAVHSDGDIVGRSFTSEDGWGAFEEFGTGSWAVSVPPAVAVRSDGTITLMLVKADGRLYQRNWRPDRGWTGFWPRRPGVRWLSVEVTFSDGVIAYVGQTYDRSLSGGHWRGGEGWVEGIDLGGPEWSAMRPVGLGPRPGTGVTMLAVTTDGHLRHRHWAEHRGWFERYGSPGGTTVWANA